MIDMKNILNINQAIELGKLLRKQNKKIILTGGCFDILHPGHLALLKSAKISGDILFVFLESDKKITELKGSERPIYTQQERASMLASLRFVDYVILLPYFTENTQYDDLISSIMPNSIATTENDPNLKHKKRQAAMVKANVIEVTKYIPNKSTTRLLKLLAEEL